MIKYNLAFIKCYTLLRPFLKNILHGNVQQTAIILYIATVDVVHLVLKTEIVTEQTNKQREFSIMQKS